MKVTIDIFIVLHQKMTFHCLFLKINILLPVANLCEAFDFIKKILDVMFSIQSVGESVNQY